MPGIIIDRISKSYGTVKALSDVSLQINEGELFGLIGADGAGKSTLFDILVTTTEPDKGSATVGSYSVAKSKRTIREIIGYMPGRFSLYQDLTVFENLKFFAAIFSTTIEQDYDKIQEIWVQLEPYRNRSAGKLSGGMKQKLALCCALVHDPRYLFLDEPTTGVDPVSRREFWEMLKRLRERGITIMVSTPYMDEAALCDRIALIQQGEILSVETPSDLVVSYDRVLYCIYSNNQFHLLNHLRDYPDMLSCFAFGDSLHFTPRSETFNPADFNTYLRQNGFSDIEIHQIEPGVEDCFIKLMNK